MSGIRRVVIFILFEIVAVNIGTTSATTPGYRDPCKDHPCQNGATCYGYADSKETIFSCFCPMNFGGKRCEIGLEPYGSLDSFSELFEEISSETQLNLATEAQFIIGATNRVTGTESSTTNVNHDHQTIIKELKEGLPDTSPIETQLTEAVTQANDDILTSDPTTDGTSRLGTEFSSTLGSKTSTLIEKSTHVRTHINSRTIKDIDTLTTFNSQTERPFYPSSEQNVFENTRTNKVQTPDASTHANTRTSSQNVHQVPREGATNGASTHANPVTNEQTTYSDNKRATSTSYLTSGRTSSQNVHQVPREGATNGASTHANPVTNEQTTHSDNKRATSTSYLTSRRTSSQNVHQVPREGATNGASTQANPVTNEQTTHSDNKRATSTSYLTSGKDTVVTKETTDKESLTIYNVAGGAGTPNPVGEDGTSIPVGGDGTPNSVGGDGDGTPNPVGGVGTPISIVWDGTPNPVGGNGTPNPVGEAGTPYPVVGAGTPNTVGGDGTPNPVGGDGTPNPIDETSSSSPIVQETEGLSGTSSKYAAAERATRGTSTAVNQLIIGDATDLVTDIVTVTESPVFKEVEVTEVVTELEKVGNNVTYTLGLTTVAPATVPQTTSSPYSTEPCIKENPNATTSTINLCLCKPVEDATHYVVSAHIVDDSSYFLRAGQQNSDLDDDFDMADDSTEGTSGPFMENYNKTISSKGASLCAHFTNLTSGRQYNFTVQAIRAPTSLLSPAASSGWYIAGTRATPPVLHAKAHHKQINLRWSFDQPTFIQYYNITFRWDDQIGFSVLELPGSQLQWVVRGLMSGGTYVIRVIAATPWNSAYSEIEMTTKLYQPRAFMKHKTPTSVDLGWTYDDDTFVEHYTIKYTLVNTNETKVVMLPGRWLESNNFNITDLVSGGIYNFRLIAESGTQASSVDLRINTELLPPILNVTTNQTSLNINWGFAQKVIFEYFNFSYSLIPNNSSKSSSSSARFNTSRIESILPLWQTHLELTNLKPGARYTVVLQAIGELTSSMAQSVAATRPQPPSGLQVMAFDATSIELGWNQTFIDQVEYFKIIYRSGRTRITKEVKSLGPVKILAWLSPGDNYKIWISTVSWGEESKRVVIEQRTKLLGPMTIDVINYTDTTVTIRYRIPRGNVVSEYTIWCEGPGCNLEASDTYIYVKSRQTHGVHTFEGLASGAKYQFVVNVWSDLMNLEGSVHQATAPGRPTNLKVTDFSSKTITITWEAPKNGTVQEYRVTFQGQMESQTGNNTFTFLTRALGATIRNLHPGDFYEIKVETMANGALSIPVQDVQSTNLAQVTGVKSHTITNNSFILEWVKADGYYDNVLVQCRNCSYTEVYRSVPKTSNRIEFTNLKSGAYYVVRLITMKNGFMDGEPVLFNVATYPDSPNRIYIKSLSDRQITLMWSGIPCDGCHVDFYSIDKVSDAGEALHNDGTSCTPGRGIEKICTKTFPKLHPGHLYTFTITAVSNGLRSREPAFYQQRTKPGIPGDITFNLIDKWRITVSWLPSGGLVDSYIINIRSDHSTIDESREIPYNRRRQDFTRLKPGTPYTISIMASVDGLVSAARSIVVHTQPDIPGRVQRFQIKPMSPVEVLATYDVPVQPNGIIEAYHISYYGITNKGKPCPSVLDRRLPGTSMRAVIGNLYAGCNYTFTITASTGAGEGRPITQFARTPIGAPKPTGRQPGVPPSNAINRNSFTVTFDTTFFDEAYGEIHSYAILVAESTTIHAVESKNISTPPVLMTWAEAEEYDIIPRYQISEPYMYADLFLKDKAKNSRKKREAVYSQDITIGKEKCTTTDTTEYCNGRLKSGRTYVYQFRGFSDTGYADTVFSPPIHLPSDQTGLIVGISVVLIVLFIIVLVLVVMVFGRRWKYIPYRGKYMLANTSEPLTGTMTSKGCRTSKIKFSRPVLLSEFCQDYHTMNAHSHYGFSQEYEAIRKVGKKLNCNAAVLADNVSKNRYTNILPYDKTRVKLSSIDDDEGSDYINANYIPGFNSPREFIACQGPLPGTTDDMWKMIWEHNVATVVMVTQLVEKGKIKCDQYWTDDHKPVLYGDIQVQMTSSTEQQDWNIREFTLQKAENVKKVRHFNYVSWPDHGVPESSDLLLGFIKHVRQQTPRNGTPTIVHCSAGVGRTGTFICLDRILHHIEEFDFVDIMANVSEMRMHRNYMVQTEQQYVFIHRCVLDMLSSKGVAPKQTPSSLNGDAAEHSCKV